MYIFSINKLSLKPCRNESFSVPTLSETPEENRSRKRSLTIAYLVLFINTACFSAGSNSVWPYLRKVSTTWGKIWFTSLERPKPFANFQHENNIGRPRQRLPPPQRKDRIAKLHYITRHVRNGCHHILVTMLNRHERCGCNEHFNVKRSRRQDSDAIYGVTKFNLI